MQCDTAASGESRKRPADQIVPRTRRPFACSLLTTAPPAPPPQHTSSCTPPCRRRACMPPPAAHQLSTPAASWPLAARTPAHKSPNHGSRKGHAHTSQGTSHFAARTDGVLAALAGILRVAPPPAAGQVLLVVGLCTVVGGGALVCVCARRGGKQEVGCARHLGLTRLVRRGAPAQPWSQAGRHAGVSAGAQVRTCGVVLAQGLDLCDDQGLALGLRGVGARGPGAAVRMLHRASSAHEGGMQREEGKAGPAPWPLLQPTCALSLLWMASSRCSGVW